MANKKKKKKLTANMSVQEFDNGYWYLDEIKKFAKDIGVRPLSGLRKDQLEVIIRKFLKTGKLAQTKPDVPYAKGKTKDSDGGLKLAQRVVHYSNNKVTKDFLVAQAKKKSPHFKEKSGSRYRLNRWWEEQLAKGVAITYGDLVDRFIKLSQTKSFEKIPSGRYINFLADFLAKEEGKDRQAAMAAWSQLKEFDIPKTYTAWKKYTSSK